MKSIKNLIRQSHEKQFSGEDYQGVAIDICEANKIPFGSDEHKQIESSPEPGCDCGFCAKAEWQD